MKKRIKIDSSLMSVTIILTGVLFLLEDLYPRNSLLNNVLDFFGISTLILGVLFRMTARGHKKKHSLLGKSLVMTGPYFFVRNPMYLGSFMIGSGFVLMVWPFWILPFFAVVFYKRFIKQIVKEEALLLKQFGPDYAAYCQKTPRIFPDWRDLRKEKTWEMFNLHEAFSTKEKRSLVFLPLAAFALEAMQRKVIFGVMDLRQVLIIFIAAVLFLIGFLTMAFRKTRVDIN